MKRACLGIELERPQVEAPSLVIVKHECTMAEQALERKWQKIKGLRLVMELAKEACCYRPETKSEHLEPEEDDNDDMFEFE